MVAVLNLFRPALPWLERSVMPRAVIVNGITAHHPEPSMAAVSATRSAVANLGRTLADHRVYFLEEPLSPDDMAGEWA